MSRLLVRAAALVAFCAVVGVSAAAWSMPPRLKCKTDATRLVTYPNNRVWPLAVLSNLPQADPYRKEVDTAISTWNKVAGANDNLSVNREGFTLCEAPNGQAVIGWDGGTCTAWSSTAVTGTTIYETSNCVLTKMSVYFNRNRTFFAGDLTDVAIHELGHFQLADHTWTEVSNMGYASNLSMVYLGAPEHEYLRRYYSNGTATSPDLYIHPFVLLTTVVPGSESMTKVEEATCSPRNCSELRAGDSVSAKLTYGNAGSRAALGDVFIKMLLGTTEIGSWKVSNYPAYAQTTFNFIGTVPAGMAAGSYDLKFTINQPKTVTEVDGPTAPNALTLDTITVATPPCIAGIACQSPDGCQNGTTSCSTGVSVCSNLTAVATGTSCGAGQVCNAGVCQPCASGAACGSLDGCQRGTTSCSTGVPVCTNVTTVANGTSCGAGQVCNAGVCRTCESGTACGSVDGCLAGTISCSTGVAVCSQLSAKPDGTACGNGSTCLGGACGSCTAGAPCHLLSGCEVGTIDCSTGVATCKNPSPLPEGTSCGDSSQQKVCTAGACSSCVWGRACQGTDGCRVGKTNCSTGQPVCSELVSAPDGTACSGGACRQGVCDVSTAETGGSETVQDSEVKGASCASTGGAALPGLLILGFFSGQGGISRRRRRESPR